tara:strand:+ start:1068 stop:1793 length:726 start_codon:yes stop_codon:yes gene_type:complete
MVGRFKSKKYGESARYFDLTKYFDYSIFGYDIATTNPNPGLTIPESAISPKVDKGELAKRIKLGASFEGLNAFTKFRADDIEQMITILIMWGSINPDNLEGQVLDFGMGSGPGAYILSQYGNNVTGVDTCEYGVRKAIEENILPAERAIVQDGFQYLTGLQPESLDFVAAFMMHAGFPHQKLCQEAYRVLKPKGQLLITGGLKELKAELQRTVGAYGKIEDVATVHEENILANVAFTYTKK